MWALLTEEKRQQQSGKSRLTLGMSEEYNERQKEKAGLATGKGRRLSCAVGSATADIKIYNDRCKEASSVIT